MDLPPEHLARLTDPPATAVLATHRCTADLAGDHCVGRCTGVRVARVLSAGLDQTLGELVSPNDSPRATVAPTAPPAETAWAPTEEMGDGQLVESLADEIGALGSRHDEIIVSRRGGSNQEMMEFGIFPAFR